MSPSRFAPFAFFMRVLFGLNFLSAGLSKLGFFGGTRVVLFQGWVGWAMPIEILCGTLITSGLFTRPAAFLASGEMAFAYFLVHAPRGGLPTQNQGVSAVLYCFAFLYIAAAGAGGFSLDSLRGKA